MIEWLNQTIGADAATYLGTFLAIVALIWGGSKVVKKSQKQTVKGGSGIQVGGSINVNVNAKKDS